MDVVALPVALVALLLFSAFMSGSETAFFSLSAAERERLKGAAGFSAHAARELLARPERLLLTLLLGNLLANLFFFTLAAELALAFERAGHADLAWATGVAAALALVLFGELLPKVFARPRAARLSSRVSWPLWVVVRLLTPPVFVLGRAIGALSLALVGKPVDAADRRADFLRLVDLSHRKGKLGDEQRRVLHELLGFSSLRVRDVMIPRVDVAAVDVAQPRELALEEIRARSVSHLLAVDGNLDRVVGMLDAHAVMLNPDVALRTLVRPVPAVPAIGTARGALTVLQERGATLALAVDEYGGTAGLVAMNDLIAQVVGEMADEHFEPARRVVARDRERFLVAGWTSLREWRERTGSDEGDESVATVGGLVVSRLDRPPRVGDVATTAGFEYVVKNARGGRVILVEAHRIAMRPAAEPPA